MTLTAQALPLTDHDRAAHVTTGQADALVVLLRELDPDEWRRPTPCEGWDVRAVAAHVAGALGDAANPLVTLRHDVVARTRYRTMPYIDAVGRQHLEERAGRSTGELVAEIARRGPAAARTARRTPRALRALPLPPTGALPPGATVGYLGDVIRARDLWMHRVDVAIATGRPVPEGLGDEEVVAQVVRDLGAVWTGPTVTLTLEGIGAGSWQLGPGSPVATLVADAVDLCRSLSGRAVDLAVRTEPAPVSVSAEAGRADEALLAARVLF